jgi:hypothetical protein
MIKNLLSIDWHTETITNNAGLTFESTEIKSQITDDLKSYIDKFGTEGLRHILLAISHLSLDIVDYQKNFK